jgi:photosystem II stability/assembly factor-like uncharacterized protein
MLVAAAAVMGGSVRAAADSGFPRVAANTDITQNDKSPVRDMAIANVAVDPNDPTHVAVVAGDWRNGTCFLYVSTDGGATWAVGKHSPIPPQFDTCAPNGGTNAWGIAYDKSGNILVATMVAIRPSTTSTSGSVILAKTTDNGNTWSTTFVKDNRQTNPPQGAGQVQLVSDVKNNRIYVGWQQRGVPVAGYGGTQRRAEIAVSTDDGASFGTPNDLEGDPASTLSAGGPNLSLGPDGTLYAFYSQSTAAKGSSSVFTSQTAGLHIVKTTDGGQNYTLLPTIMPVAKQPAFFSFPDLVAAPYNGGTSLVLVFEAIAQGTAGSQYQLRDIYSMNSTDGGQTWNSQTRVTDDDISTDLGNKYVPGISAAPNGRIDTSWIDFRDDNGNLLSNTYYASSTDGGSTWSKNLKLSDQPSNRHYGQFANYSDIRSNTNMVSNNYAAYIAWDDTRNASSSADAQDVYFGSVQQAAIPQSTSTTVLYIIAAVAGGLVFASLVLVGAGLVVRRRRRSGTPKPPVSTAAN